MSQISPSAYGEHDPVLQERLSKCQSLPEISEVMRQRALELGATRDAIAPEVLHFDSMRPVEVSGGRVSRTVKIRGVDATFSAESVPELEQEIATALNGASEDGTTQPRGADGKFTSRRELGLAEKTELDLRFRRGEISTPDYLKQSGAIENAFATMAKEKLGIDVDDLATTQQVSDAWVVATEQWLNSPDGESWEGGQENLRRVQEIIVANGLAESPSVQTVSQVVNFMRKNHLVVPYEGKTTKDISEATSVEEINAASRAALGLPPRNSNLWGRG